LPVLRTAGVDRVARRADPALRLLDHARPTGRSPSVRPPPSPPRSTGPAVVATVGGVGATVGGAIGDVGNVRQTRPN